MSKIIDVHVHVGASSTLQVAGGAEDVLRIMDKNGIDISIISPIPGYEDPDGIKDSMIHNDNMAHLIKKYPDRFPRALGVVEPRHGKKALPEVDRILGDLGLHGLMFHNDFNGISVDHPSMFAIMERAAKYKDVIMMVHTAQHSSLEAPFMLGTLAEAFPDITFLDAHPMMDITHLRATIALAKKHPNIVFDTCLSHHHLFPIEKAVEGIGEDRLLFGSDNPYFDHCIDKDIIETSSVSQEIKRKIFSENAKKLFKL